MGFQPWTPPFLSATEMYTSSGIYSVIVSTVTSLQKEKKKNQVYLKDIYEEKKHRHVWWLRINHRYQNLNFVSAFKTGLVVPCPFISVKTTITWECAFFQFGEKHDIIFFHFFRVMWFFFLCLISFLDHLMDFILFVLSLIHDILNTTWYILWVHNVCPYF